MSDEPADWQKFRLQYPGFFPPTSPSFNLPGHGDLTEWMYALADEWHKFPTEQKQRILPPLLWYRNRLRSVWAKTDRHGYSLAILLGFDSEAKVIAAQHPGETGCESLYRTALVPGRNASDSLNCATGGLPQGKPVVNGITGQIQWAFGSNLQSAVYQLMQERWRAKICPQCEKYFVAMKTAQKVCSPQCSIETKRERARTWWTETGSERRKARTR